jgi:5,5'-dehydrodivanillate O-demethylase oxygenase subunit
MLSKEANDRLCQVGPGTPMGELMRRYWHPIAPFDELLKDPVKKVRILGEDLVLYRDRSNNLGLIGDRCAHRSVGMEYGIPEAEGLRCPYHGWLYDATGQCTETPLEPSESTFKERVKIAGYPVQEMGGLVFAYLGPQPAPLLPPWDLLVWPNAVRQIGWCVIPCNWLQCQENAADPVHSVYLHGNFFKYQLERAGLLEERAADQTTHRAFTSMRSAVGYDGVESHTDRYGLRKGMKYSTAKGADEDKVRWHSYMVFPNWTRPGGGGVRHEFQIRVPMDDTHTYHIAYEIYAAPEHVEVPKQDVVPSYEVPIRDENGKPILDFVLSHDMVAWWSQGALTDRSKEKLGTTDSAIILFRRQLEQQMRIVEDGGEPMNVFRDPSQMGDIIHLTPRVNEHWDDFGMVNYRAMFHKGYDRDDADRYGPAIDLAKEVMRRVAEGSENQPVAG